MEFLNFNQKEFDKMEQNIKNLVKANGLTIKFSLNYFLELCIDNPSDWIEYCHYFVQAKGLGVLL